MRVITRIDVPSFVKFYTIMMALIGLVFGVITAFATVALSGVMGDQASSFGFGGVLAIIFTPALYAIMGLVFGFIQVVIINFVLKIIKGIRYETAEAPMVSTPPPVPVAMSTDAS